MNSMDFEKYLYIIEKIEKIHHIVFNIHVWDKGYQKSYIHVHVNADPVLKLKVYNDISVFTIWSNSNEHCQWWCF